MQAKEQNIFYEEIEQTAITRIQKFAKIAKKMGFEIRLGFSGGKDSQVVYDLCVRAGIEFQAYFNHSFESKTTLRFIREFYPDVIGRRDHKFGFIENIWRNHNSILPTVQFAYCCADYKHNRKYNDDCAITGVRRAESKSRSQRTAFEAKNKTTLKKHKTLVSEYFEEHCQSTGAANIIHLKPIIDWSDDDVWEYIYRHRLPINPEYKYSKRVGCIVCPKANFTSNAAALMKYPKLIDAFILAREKRMDINWVITAENRDCIDDKVYYICRWLNHSFMPFTKKQEKLYLQVREKYNKLHNE